METRNGLMWTLVVLLILVLIGPAFWKAEVIGDGVDLHGTIWFYGWISDCINNVKNPSFTDQFYYPYGKDIFAHTGNNFVDAVLFYSFKLFIDYPYNYLIFIGFILFLNLYALNNLLKLLIENQIVKWSALIFSLSSPYVLFELIAGRPTQACLFAAPMAMAELVQILKGDLRLRRAFYLGFWGLHPCEVAWSVIRRFIHGHTSLAQSYCAARVILKRLNTVALADPRTHASRHFNNWEHR